MSSVGERRKRLHGEAKRASKLLTVSILVLLASVCIVENSLKPVKATGGTVYYFQPVIVKPELEGNYYMDTPLPKGPAVERNACSFHTRILVKNYTVNLFNVHIRMKPINVGRIMTIRIGWSDDAFHGIILGGSIARTVSDQGIFPVVIPKTTTIAAGQRLYVSIEIDNGSLVFGDPEHQSAIEFEESLDLSGQPIPESPLPVVTLLAALTMTFAIMKLRVRKKSEYTPTGGYCEFK